jgi:hypothetical protein
MRRGLIFGRMHMQRHPLPTYQLKPDYPVLAPLSRSYPKSKGRLPTRYSPVRHSTQGRSPFLVRLACVRHAASVHSEPESNSPVMYNCRATLLLFINLKKSPGDDLLSHQWTGSIIGAGGLNFRVRNGIGWWPLRRGHQDEIYKRNR